MIIFKMQLFEIWNDLAFLPIILFLFSKLLAWRRLKREREAKERKLQEGEKLCRFFVLTNAPTYVLSYIFNKHLGPLI